MKKIFFAALGLAVFAVSCKKDIDADVKKELVNGGGSGVDTLVGEITVNTTVTRTTYLKGIVYVKPGITLTVNAGVTIKGSPGAIVPDTINLAVNKGTLVVERGGKLVANGTPTSPIVWTSAQPAGSRNYGDWGGVVIFGKAPIKTSTGAATNFYEAFPQSDARNYYGGTDPNDNSGSITYNRLEFGGGIILKPNQEVNGLTFCGAGKGTVAHHIEVANNGDDGFEFFGGTINLHHLLSYSNKDDDFDFDEGYNGNLQFIIAYRSNLCDNSGSEMIELDNNATSTDFATHTNPTIANATLVGPHSLVARPGSGGRFDGAVYVRRAGRIKLANSLIIGDSLPTALAFTPTTRNNIDGIAGAVDPSYIRYNLFQTYAAIPVIWDNDESNQIVDGTATAAPDNALIAVLGDGTQLNSALATPADFKLDGTLKPIAGSPALSGGVSLTFLDPFFVSTTQRGAVLTSDVWTATGTWISIATN
ncbi:MAG: hypothetical protein ABIR18_04060 [Chitinophagaceae bacterium]